MKALLTAALLALPLTAAAQPVRVTIVNGTTQEPASVDLVTLYRLGQGMEPVDQVENPDAQTHPRSPRLATAPDRESGPSCSRPPTAG